MRGGATEEEARDLESFHQTLEEHDHHPGRVSIVLACHGELEVHLPSGGFGPDEALAVEEGSGGCVSCSGVQTPDMLRQSYGVCRRMHQPLSKPSSASLGLTDYPPLDMLSVSSKSVSFGAGQIPGAPTWCAQIE